MKDDARKRIFDNEIKDITNGSDILNINKKILL
jgi:hypothetical protein